MLQMIACIWDIITTFVPGKFVLHRGSPEYLIYYIVWNI